MEEFLALKNIEIIFNLTNTLEANIGIRDKVLGQFVKHIADNANDYQDFQKKLEQNGAEFPRQLTLRLYDVWKSKDTTRRNRSRSRSPPSFEKVLEQGRMYTVYISLVTSMGLEVRLDGLSQTGYIPTSLSSNYRKGERIVAWWTNVEKAEFSLNDPQNRSRRKNQSGHVGSKWEAAKMRDANVLQDDDLSSESDGFEVELNTERAPFLIDQQPNRHLKNAGDERKQGEIKTAQITTTLPLLHLRPKSQPRLSQEQCQLPIYAHRLQLLQLVAENNVIIVIGETGSGKTTQITQYLYQEGYARYGRIACTQPRRMAAISVARRVSEEQRWRLGDRVGYCIRFEDCTTNKTRIKYMTDGMLMREAILDPQLQNYNVIILDEAHERGLQTDILFGILKDALKVRRDLKVIVTSATLEAEKFSQYFDGCPIFHIQGRSYPVDVFYTVQSNEDYLTSAIDTVFQVHTTQGPGDILVFLTGQEEIDQACARITQHVKSIGCEPIMSVPVYAAQPNAVQSRVFAPAPCRKVIVATNIAEASLTIDGILYVIDPGYVKMKVFNGRSGMEQLIVVRISQSSAIQRSGRAGRTAPGKWYRLYTEQQFNEEMKQSTIPEIQRSNLANIVLSLKAIGIHDIIKFNFLDPPPRTNILEALESLYALGALDTEGLLTSLGRHMSGFPLDPQLSKALITSVSLSCSSEVITIISLLTVQSVYYRPRAQQSQADRARAIFNDPHGDHLSLMHVYKAWKASGYSSEWCQDNFIISRNIVRAREVRRQLKRIFRAYKLAVVSTKDIDAIRKAIAAGFFTNAVRKDIREGYRTLSSQDQIYIHPSSCLFHRCPRWVVYHELVFTTKEYMRNVLAVEPQWLVELAPHYFKKAEGMSKIQQQEKIEPLFNRFEPGDGWRLSRRRG